MSEQRYVSVRYLKNFRDWILALVFPNWCPFCNQEPAFTSEGGICFRCEESIRRIPLHACSGCASPLDALESSPDLVKTFSAHGRFLCPVCESNPVPPAFASVRAAVYAEGLVREGLIRFKYHGYQWPVPLFRKLISQRIQSEELNLKDHWDWVTFPPLHPVRERERGFNQSRILGEIVASCLGLPLYDKALRRIRPTPTQTMLGREQRLRNMQSAFQAAPHLKAKIQGSSALLVDDIFTTGATLEACAQELKSMGVARVDAFCLARKPRIAKNYIAVNSLKSSKSSANN